MQGALKLYSSLLGVLPLVMRTNHMSCVQVQEVSWHEISTWVCEISTLYSVGVFTGAYGLPQELCPWGERHSQCSGSFCGCSGYVPAWPQWLQRSLNPSLGAGVLRRWHCCGEKSRHTFAFQQTFSYIASRSSSSSSPCACNVNTCKGCDYKSTEHLW